MGSEAPSVHAGECPEALEKGLPLPYWVLSLCSCQQMCIYGWIEVLAPKLNTISHTHLLRVKYLWCCFGE